MLIYFNTEGINYYFLCPFICFFFLVGSSYTAGHTAFGKYTNEILEYCKNKQDELEEIVHL